MTDLLLTHGSYLSIFLVLVLTGSGLPIPEEVPIILAGILSANQTLNPWLAFAWCLAGALVGDCIMYFIGYHFGRPVLRDHPWFSRFVTPEREIQIEEQFRQHGLKVFFVSRFLVGLRSPVYLTAGILRLSFKRFVMIDLFCASVVVGTFFWLTYLLGESIARWVKRAEVALTIAVVLTVVVVGLYLWRRHKRKLATAEKIIAVESASCNSSSNSTPPELSAPPEQPTGISPEIPVKADKSGV
jgi:membrane protein DedA with SNARE-associated domain